MDMRYNTIFGWVMAAGIAAAGLSALSSKYFHASHPERPEKMSYAIAGVESDGAVAAGPSFNTLLASADVEAGKSVFKKCTACHTDTQGGANGIGPNLYGVVGEKAATGRGGFAFSDALKSKNATWDFATLNEWLTSPNKFAPGTKMSFAGLGDAKDRANLIGYLNTLGSNVPLPKADAPEAAEGDAKDGEKPVAGTTAEAKPAGGAVAGAETKPAETVKTGPSMTPPTK